VCPTVEPHHGQTRTAVRRRSERPRRQGHSRPRSSGARAGRVGSQCRCRTGPPDRTDHVQRRRAAGAGRLLDRPPHRRGRPGDHRGEPRGIHRRVRRTRLVTRRRRRLTRVSVTGRLWPPPSGRRRDEPRVRRAGR
jgi:hypothetical protein